MNAVILIVGFFLGTSFAFAQLSYLPAEPPYRPDAIVSGMLKIRLTPDAAFSAAKVLESYGLHFVRQVLPFEQSLLWKSQREGLLKNRTMNLQHAMEIENRLLRSYVVSYSNTAISPERMIAMLRVGCGPIECAAPWCVMQLVSEPNDPQRETQSLLRTISVYDAWDIEPGSDTVVIGISDSGLRQEHEDLIDALFVNKNEIPDNNIDDDANGYVDDQRGYNFAATQGGSTPGNTFNSKNGHGTGVGGICGATVDNNIGIAGIARNCKIFPLRTMPDNSSGIVYGYESLIYCATNNIDVVNCSWGGFSPSCIDADVIAYTIARGTAVVAAAGNHGTAAAFYPASYPGVLSVGVVDPNDNVIPMSAHGPTVDVMAPGHDSWTTSNDGGYGSFCCTSGSAPIVSAIVALVRSRHPELSPMQACAVVREAVDERPWKNIPNTIDSLLLPRGRVNVLSAVSLPPDTVISIDVDTVAIREVNGSFRWTVGDTVQVVTTIINTLAPWTINDHSAVTLAGTKAQSIRSLNNTTPFTRDVVRDERVVLPPLSFEILKETDTAAYAIFDLQGKDGKGASTTRRLSFPITPSPAFTTLSNNRMRVSMGDRGRIGNTDIERGQGEGLRYEAFCGQLYEGGLMVYANGKVVDAIRNKRGVNDHFRPKKRFIAPDASRAIVRDDDAPDSVRVGVEVELDVHLDSAAALLVIDATIVNIGIETLRDLSVAWFYDWDLGTQPAKNRTWREYGTTQVATSTKEQEPVVAMTTTSRYQDGTPILCGLDNTTTYNGFTNERKIKIFQDPDSVQYDGENDIAAIVGMRFHSLVPPGHHRSFRHTIAMDTSVVAALELLNSSIVQPLPIDTLFVLDADPIFPNPGNEIIYIPVDGITFVPATFTIYNSRGQIVKQQPAGDVSLAFIQPVDVRDLASGTYEVRLNDGLTVRSWSFVIVH
ncbi:MAG: S8 family peptidase [Candidatus Kapabacteria bacterium]|nr:S8 family peptidase [Candidatus Kapabacteria bacterium]